MILCRHEVLGKSHYLTASEITCWDLTRAMPRVRRAESLGTSGSVAYPAVGATALTLSPRTVQKRSARWPWDVRWRRNRVCRGTAGAMLDMLKGIRVVSFNHFLLGPMGMQALGDLGADVISVESVEGAWQRHWSGGTSGATDRVRFTCAPIATSAASLSI
jgi:hypothetical protein